MKLRFEDESAKDAYFGQAFKSPTFENGWVLLEMEVPQQEMSNWCWAALSVGLSSYYHQEVLSQEYIVHQLLEVPEKGSTPDDYNKEYRLDFAFQFVNVFSHWSLGKPSFDRIKVEINQGRPIGVRIQWYKGGAHYVLLTGYKDEDRSVKIEDPMRGKFYMKMDDFPKEFRNGGAVWAETFWTQKGNIGKEDLEESSY
mgnify:CR=1 FL=1